MSVSPGRVLLPIMLLILSGCFRQAGEALEPINNPTSPPLARPTQETSPAITQLPGTATIPPIVTVIRITPEESPALAAPLVSSSTPLAPSGANTTPTSGLVIISATDTPAFITPGAPSGPVVIDPPTPTIDLSATTTPSGLVTPTAVGGEIREDCVYIIQPGDNLFRIAVNNDVSLDDLRAANPTITGDLIQVGDRVVIPGCDERSVEPVVSASETPIGTVTTPDGDIIHIVQAGDTLLAIARTYGVTVEAIAAANELDNPLILEPGQILKIPYLT